MENTHNTPLEESEVQHVLKDALISVFETAHKDKQIEIHKVFKFLEKNHYTSFDFEEALDYTRSDIKSVHYLTMK